MTPEPLTKRLSDGTLYRRPDEVESRLTAILDLSRDEVLDALHVRDARAPGFIPSECLVHLLRRTRFDNRDTYFEQLYRAVMDRIDRVLPRVEHALGDSIGVDLGRDRIRDQVRDRFQEILINDRTRGGDRLDFFETRFAAAIAKLRSTARQKVWREAVRQESLHPDDETGEMSLEVERAAGSLDLPRNEIWDDPDYRLGIEAAIDALPPEQSRTIAMLRAGIPAESNDPDVVTVSKVMGCVDKTVRNRRDAAIKAIRRKLGLDDPR